jgi:hypothetical protein
MTLIIALLIFFKLFQFFIAFYNKLEGWQPTSNVKRNKRIRWLVIGLVWFPLILLILVFGAMAWDRSKSKKA